MDYCYCFSGVLLFAVLLFGEIPIRKIETEKHNKLFIMFFTRILYNNGLCLQTSAAHTVKHTANIIQN